MLDFGFIILFLASQMEDGPNRRKQLLKIRLKSINLGTKIRFLLWK
jgi:hypothetical protein